MAMTTSGSIGEGDTRRVPFRLEPSPQQGPERALDLAGVERSMQATALEAHEERPAGDLGVERVDGGLERGERIVGSEAKRPLDRQDTPERCAQHRIARDVVPQGGEELRDVTDPADGDVAIAAAAERSATPEPGKEHRARAFDGGRQHVPVVHEPSGSYVATDGAGNVSPADGALI